MQGAEKVGPEDSSNCANQTPKKGAFLDVAINGELVGRIIIGLYGDTVPFGNWNDKIQRGELISGAACVSYRRKEFVKIMPNYVQHDGLRSYGVDEELARKTGSNVAIDILANEWEKQNENFSGTKNVATSVGIIIRDPSIPPPKVKLVARKGKLEIDEEEVGEDLNGTVSHCYQRFTGVGCLDFSCGKSPRGNGCCKANKQSEDRVREHGLTPTDMTQW